MATQQSMTKRTVDAQSVVLEALARTFGHPAPRFPAASRHGREHLNMVQWEALADWVKVVTDTVWSAQGEDVTTITVDVVDDDQAEDVTEIEKVRSELLRLGQAVSDGINAAIEENVDPDDVTASDGIADPTPTDYDAMTRAELLALADERGVTVAGSRPTKADVIEALQHADAHN